MSVFVREEMLLDLVLPTFDAVLTQHSVVDADPLTTYAAARDLDFMRLRTPMVPAAFWLRDLPARVIRPVHRSTPPPLAHRRLGDPAALNGWVRLGERPGRELAFGAVTRFGAPRLELRGVSDDEFVTFDEPGFVKVAASFSVRPYGERRSLLTYEIRVATTDIASRRRFAFSWLAIRPVFRHLVGATLATIRHDAEERERRIHGAVDG